MFYNLFSNIIYFIHYLKMKSVSCFKEARNKIKTEKRLHSCLSKLIKFNQLTNIIFNGVNFGFFQGHFRSGFLFFYFYSFQFFHFFLPSFFVHIQSKTFFFSIIFVPRFIIATFDSFLFLFFIAFVDLRK